MSNAFTDRELNALRDDIREQMSERRFAHTLGVEQMAARLAALYLPEEVALLRAAALLHDMTKELGREEQAAILAQGGVVLRPDEACAHKIWHGMTAALLTPTRYPHLADPVLLSAVRWHTTGHDGMTVPEALLYLADYIEEGRVIPACVALRRAFFDAEPEKMDAKAREIHLWEIMLRSLECTVEELTAKGAPVCLDTAGALRFVKEKLTLLKGTK